MRRPLTLVVPLFTLLALFAVWSTYNRERWAPYIRNVPQAIPAQDDLDANAMGNSIAIEDSSNSTTLDENSTTSQSSSSSSSTTTTASISVPTEIASLDTILKSHFPFTSYFPAKIWQKTGPRGILDNVKPDIQTWATHNPRYRHEILSDASADEYVRERYADSPALVDFYLSLQVPILKADILRHLILYADGGIYSDLDVACEAPIDSWIPAQYKDKANVVVGIEFNGWQFASWTMMAKPGSPHIAAVIRYIVDELMDIADDHNVSVSQLQMHMIPDVVDASGPQAMTLAILDSVQSATGQLTSKANFSDPHEPVLLGDVLVLPIAAFAAGMGGFPSDRGPYLVTHHYAGSWKNLEGGENGAPPVGPE